jgi:hypothetical protein
LWHPGQRGINGSHNPRLFRHSGGFGGSIDAMKQRAVEGLAVGFLTAPRLTWHSRQGPMTF